MTGPICPICSSRMRPWMTIPGDWRRPRAPGAHHLFWCDGCRYGQLSPRPDPAEISNHYVVEQYHTHINPGEHERLPRKKFLDRLRVHLAWRVDGGRPIDAAWLEEHLGPSPRRACDLGCGDGWMLALLRDNGHDVVGVEPDPEARGVARGRGMIVHAGTAEAIPEEVRGGRFDAVFMSHVLEHCLDPVRAIENAAGLLGEDGLLVVETPNNAARGLERAGAAWHWLDVPRHLNFFTGDSLRRITEKVGLKVKAIEFKGYERQFDADWLDAEARIGEAFAGMTDAPRPRSTRGSSGRAWSLLLETIWLPPDRKYDSVRVLAGPSAS